MTDFAPYAWEATQDSLIGVVPRDIEILCDNCPVVDIDADRQVAKFERVACSPILARAMHRNPGLNGIDTENLGYDTDLSTKQAEAYARCLARRLSGESNG